MVLLAGCGTKESSPAGIAQYTLNLKSNPAGSGIFSVDSGATFDAGTEVPVTVSPRITGKYVFLRWEGDANGTTEQVTVTMDDNKTLTAKFEELYAVTAVANPDSGGIILRVPSKDYYHLGDTVLIRLNKTNPGYKFIGWNNNTTDTAKTLLLVVRNDTTFTANFEEKFAFNFNPDPANGGTVVLTPTKDYYDDGDVVIVTVTPASGYMFVGWRDPITGEINTDYDNDNPYTVIVGENSETLLIPEFFNAGGL
jgi:uncharacterized repeat protein (TIGR02543 family)